MSGTFNGIVEEVQKLSTEEKQELHMLLEKYLIEARREEIHRNYVASRERVEAGELTFSDNVDELRKALNEQ